jgi:hypothetical protein
MRVYCPTTLDDLATALVSGVVGAPSGVPAHAVTPAVREWYIEGDSEELEYAVLLEAAEASLRLIAADPKARPRRVVLAADVEDSWVTPVSSRFRSAVTLAGPLPLSRVVSAHTDEKAAEKAVAEAVGVLDKADAGDDDAQFVLDEAEAQDLLWFDASELQHLVEGYQS